MRHILKPAPATQRCAAIRRYRLDPAQCLGVVHYPLLATPCRGGRKLNLGLLPFKTLLLWLAYLAVQTFGIVGSVALAQAP
jgi:hypothetical protein